MIIVLVALFSGSGIFALVFFIFTLWGLFEFYSSLQKKIGSAPPALSTIIASPTPLLLTLYFIGVLNKEWLILLSPFLLIPFIIELLKPDTHRTIKNCASILTGIVLIGATVPFLIGVYEMGAPEPFMGIGKFPRFLMGFFLVIWANDTGAYLIGKATGKHPLSQRISPGKTWEGTLGGILIGLTVGWFWYYDSPLFSNILTLGVFLFLICVLAIIGDLVASMIKRELKVKDFGYSLPGHGGILDRIDALLFTSPFVYTYLNLIGVSFTG